MNAIEFANQVAHNKHSQSIESQQRWITELEDRVKIAQDNLVAANVRLEEMQKRTPDTIKLTPKMIEIVEMMLAGSKLCRTWKRDGDHGYELVRSGYTWQTVRKDFVEALISYGIIRDSIVNRSHVYTLSVPVTE